MRMRVEYHRSNGNMPGPQSVDISPFHGVHGHAHEGLLLRTTKDVWVMLMGQPQSCAGCSAAKGSPKATPSSTHGRSLKKLGRIFVEFSAPKPVSEDRKTYALIAQLFLPRNRYEWNRTVGHAMP